MIKVGVVGGTGYSGVELLRLLAAHPEADVRVITSRKEAGTPVSDIFQSLRGRYSLAFSDPAQADLTQCDVVFFATPNGVAMNQADALLKAGVRVVDFSADFRIKDVALWERWYKMSHASPHLVSEAIYGLPEMFRQQIRGARLVANPGCYPTATQLGFLPLVEAGVVDVDHLIADTKSGVSGAGRKEELGLLYGETADSLKAYSVAGHRHQPEVEQGLTIAAGKPVHVTFVPHLTPMIRGIHCTLYARITREADFQKLFEERFAGEPFVDIMPPGSQPDTRSVRASNMCRIAIHRPQNGDTLVVLAVEDNLVKGAAGQAIQNMNIMFGLPETQGLSGLPVLP
jgi:N-acetyl-gamma-glutamyl-phosphate reductase